MIPSREPGAPLRPGGSGDPESAGGRVPVNAVEPNTPTVQREPLIAVIGLGHVGLPTALGFAEMGWNVVGADDDAQKVARISEGTMPFYEPGAEELLRKHLRSGRFCVAADICEAIQEGNVLFVCVGTPQREDGSADLSQVEAVARTIARHLNGYKLIVEKSTTPVRTAERIKHTIRQYRNGDHQVDVAVNPEFMREGSALQDFFNPDRIVLGVEAERARILLLKIFRPLLDRLDSTPRVDLRPAASPHADRRSPQSLTPPPPDHGARLVVTNLNTAELIKHAANGFLAMKISFINMMSDLCEAAGADVKEVARGLGLDHRIGPSFLQAGIGYGGYCLPKDLRALIRIGESQGVDVSLLKAVEQINEQRIHHMVEKVRAALWVLKGKTIGILGLAFKPMTDDLREAPSLRIVHRLLGEGANLRLHDPQAMDNLRPLLPEEPGRIVYARSPYAAAEGAHALLLLTEWEQYLLLDLAKLRAQMEVPIFIDGRNLFDPEIMRGHGFEYYGMGR